jgi:hypothetical protein
MRLGGRPGQRIVRVLIYKDTLPVEMQLGRGYQERCFCERKSNIKLTCNAVIIH